MDLNVAKLLLSCGFVIVNDVCNFVEHATLLV